jgi:hypothetical protein
VTSHIKTLHKFEPVHKYRRGHRSALKCNGANKKALKQIESASAFTNVFVPERKGFQNRNWKRTDFKMTTKTLKYN